MSPPGVRVPPFHESGRMAVELCKLKTNLIFATCRADKLNFVKGLGVKKAFDHEKVDFTKLLPQACDVVIDAARPNSFCELASFSALKSGGTFVTLSGDAVPNTDTYGIWNGLISSGTGLAKKAWDAYAKHRVHYRWGFMNTSGPDLHATFFKPRT